MLTEARYYEPEAAEKVRCKLCPHGCLLIDGSAGKCKIRYNSNGKLYTATYGIISALHSDPVEKKPLYHFFPGKTILSLGSYGCNLACIFCQNWRISQNAHGYNDFQRRMQVAEIVEHAANVPDNIGIAFTYNEPIINIEYLLDLAAAIKQTGLHTAVISNGFIEPAPLQDLLLHIDAFNIDLKAFDNKSYLKFTGACLEPVLRTLKIIHNSGKHLEITHLIVPGMNDDIKVFERMLEWIAGELGKTTVLHISKYFPCYQYHKPPAEDTAILRFLETAKQSLHYCYGGNLTCYDFSDTVCHVCGSLQIKRKGYITEIGRIGTTGRCSECNQLIIKHTC